MPTSSIFFQKNAKKLVCAHKMATKDKRTKFVIEVDEIQEHIENCPDLISNGDVGGVCEAFNNSIFKKYVKENKEFQLDLWKRAAENGELPYEMGELLWRYIDDDIQATVKVHFEGEESEDEEPDVDE